MARELVKSGAEVACLLGTGAPTVEAACRELEHAYGITARGYTDLGRMLDAEQLDALAILSPAESHEAYLERALGASLHVLCEKPLVWGGPSLARRAGSLVERYAEQGLVLQENCQWPCTLPAFRELYPDAPDAVPERFAMRLAPESTGLRALGDAMPHPLSLLQALVGDGPARIESPAFEATARELRVRFAYCASGCRVEVETDLVRSDRIPRPAAYALDGLWVERQVRLPGYEIRFRAGDRLSEPLDPLERHVRGFVGELASALAGAAPAPSPAAAVRMELLETLALAWERAGSRQDGW